MRCPNRKCKKQTDRIVVRVDKEGKARQGCYACIDRGVHEHVYTARKFWTGEEAYGAKKNEEMNQEWGRKLVERASNPRRHMPQRGQR